MGRPPKFKEPNEPVSIRLPITFLKSIPENKTVTDYIWECISNKIDTIQLQTTASKPIIDENEKNAIKTVIELFTSSLKIPAFSKTITDEIANAIETLEKVIQ